MEIFDTHTHLNDAAFLGREDDQVAVAKKAGVTRMNIVGSNRVLNESAIDLADRFEGVYATIGWHPDDAAEFDQRAEETLRTGLSKEKVVALGEIGLDYHWMVRPKEEQAWVFRRQIQVAKEMAVPFQVHTREALEDTYQILKEEGVGPAGGIMHSFSGTYDQATRFMDLGLMISFSGVLTFKKSQDEQEAVRKLPADYLLVETDAPYLTPVPYRGRENSPAYTLYTLEKMADLRGQSLEELAAITTTNALRIFKLEGR